MMGHKNASTSTTNSTFPTFIFEFEGTASGSANSLQLSLIEFYDSNAKQMPSSNVKKITNPSGNSPYSEGPANAMDGSLFTKWLDFNVRVYGKSVLVIELHSPFSLVKYVVYSANDFPERDPINWKLFGSTTGNDRVLLDSRSDMHVDDQERYTPFGEFSLSAIVAESNSDGLEVKKNSQDDKKDADVRYVPPPQLSRQTSADITTFWTNENKQTCPEYEEIAQRMIVKRSLMSDSTMQRVLAVLRQKMDAKPLANSFQEELVQSIQKAYSLSKPQEVQYCRCSLAGYSLNNSINNMYQYMGWRKEFMHAALRELREKEEASGLIVILSLLARGGEECQARKVMAFNTLLQRVSALSTPAAVTTDVSTEQTQNGDELKDVTMISSENGPLSETKKSESTTTTTSSSSSSSSSSSRLAQQQHQKQKQLQQSSLSIIRNFFLNFIEDYKYKSFKMAFLEPSKLYFQIMQDMIMRDDVEVHGSNMYAAVLLSTLGVRLPFSVYLRDEAKGCCSFLRCENVLKVALDEMLLPEHFGKDFKSLPECKKAMNAREVVSAVRTSQTQRNQLVFDGSCPLVLANNCVNPSVKVAVQRKELAHYLSRFVHFFEKEFFLEKAALAVVGGEGQPREFQIVFEMFLQEEEKQEKQEKQENQTIDVKQWLYDENYTFSIERAIKLFRFIGIVD